MFSGPPDSFPRLVGDIGGTNARFALILHPGGALAHERILAAADYPSLRAAIDAYLAAADTPRPRWAAIGIATPVTGDDVRMTNHHWSFSITTLRASLGLDRLEVLNDFTALALAVPALPADALEQVGGRAPVAGTPIAVIGAGTGLGVSGLIPGPHGYTPLAAEGGHTTLAAANDREAAIIAAIRDDLGGHVSAERLVSGPGLSLLYTALARLAGTPPAPLTPSQVTECGLSGACPLCREALDVFCAMLGTVASDVVLTLGARGGVYIGGGIVPRLGDYFRKSPFRARFEAKGRFSTYLRAVPVYVIHAPTPALLGAALALDAPAAPVTSAP